MDLSGPVKAEPRIEMTAIDPNMEGSDLSFERAADDLGLVEGSSGKKRKVFPHHITSVLRNLYKSGMIGVGIQYSSQIDTACERTGLSRAQVKSWIKRTKYHQKRVLRQEEDKDTEGYHGEQPNLVIGNPGNVAGLTYIDNPTDDPLQHHHMFIRENVDTITNRGLVIVDDDSPTTHQPHSSRNEVIPSLERHKLTPEVNKASSEHMKNYSSHSSGGGATSGGGGSKRPKPIAVYSEDIPRVTRNEALIAAVREQQHKSPTDHHQQQQQATAPLPTSHQLYTTTPIPQHAIQVTQQHIPIQTAILQPVALTSHAHVSAPPTIVMTNGTPAKITPPVKETPAQEAARLFKKIERNFKRLDELGYQGFAFSIHGEDTQLVYSGPIGHCFTPPLLSYLRAVIIAANPPPLLPQINTGHITAVTQQQSTQGAGPPAQQQPTSRPLYMYDTNPSRVQQRTAIYELSEADSVDENGDRDDNEYETVPVDSFIGANGRAVHVVVTTQDPNYIDNGVISE